MKFAVLLFWILMILWLIGGYYWSDRTTRAIGTGILPWLCVALLGFIATGNPFDH